MCCALLNAAHYEAAMHFNINFYKDGTPPAPPLCVSYMMHTGDIFLENLYSIHIFLNCVKTIFQPLILEKHFSLLAQTQTNSLINSEIEDLNLYIRKFTS